MSISINGKFIQSKYLGEGLNAFSDEQLDQIQREVTDLQKFKTPAPEIFGTHQGEERFRDITRRQWLEGVLLQSIISDVTPEAVMKYPDPEYVENLKEFSAQFAIDMAEILIKKGAR